MAKSAQSKQSSKEIRDEAMKIARSRQLPGQTKEQTKQIAQGIEKGMAQFLKQQSEKTRELDKKIKKAKRSSDQKLEAVPDEDNALLKRSKTMLPWVLLALTWIGIGIASSVA